MTFPVHISKALIFSLLGHFFLNCGVSAHSYSNSLVLPKYLLQESLKNYVFNNMQLNLYNNKL